jgi:type VI secretion system protein ImpM
MPGWYGKIPCLGDFISRRLPPGFISVWDTWLQRSIAASHEQLKERWLDLYLNSPIWRFALMQGLLHEEEGIWTGVLMPSVDNVGRYFPLTIAERIEPRSGMILSVFSSQSWFAALERIALATLNINALPDDLDRNLADNPFPSMGGAGRRTDAQELASWWQTESSVSKMLDLPSENSLADLFDAAAEELLARTGSGKSFWWTTPLDTSPVQLHCFAGLPPETHYASMLQSRPYHDGEGALPSPVEERRLR